MTDRPEMTAEVFDLFPPVETERMEPGFLYDSLGMRTRLAYRGGGTGQAGLFKPWPRDSWEWIPLLWSVATAGASYTAVELGAGWGPWISGAYVAARNRGIGDIRVYGVEAEPNHFAYMIRHFADNAIPETDRILFQGLIAAESGAALFPLTDTPETSWGLRKLGRESRDVDALLARHQASPVEGRPGVYSLAASPHHYMCQKTISLADLIGDRPRIDFLHADIQGSEAEVLGQAIGLLDARCRVLAVGTHSHPIEDRLRALFTAHGWVQKHDSAMHHDARGMLRDGHQVWVNPAAAPA